MKDFSSFFQSLNQSNNNSSNLRGSNINPGDTGNQINSFDDLIGDMPHRDHGNLRGYPGVPDGFGSVIYALIEKWYLLIVGPAMYITYKLFKALEDHGVFDILYKDARDALDAMISISNRCFSKIADIDAFFSCF